jgi:hypothetical protein
VLEVEEIHGKVEERSRLLQGLTTDISSSTAVSEADVPGRQLIQVDINICTVPVH